MSQQAQWTASPSVEPPAKRRRGRPRKIPSPLTPGADSSVKSTKTHVVASSGPASNESVGQPVSGVIEGSFDDGYLVNVKLPNSDINMRGAVFLPGRYIPVTRATDVAPQVPMIPRVNIDPPFVQPQSGATLGEKAQIAETDSADLSATIFTQKACDFSEQYGKTIGQAGVSLGEKSQIPEIDYSDPSGSVATITQKVLNFSEICRTTFGPAGFSVEEKAQIAETDSVNLSATILAQKDCEFSEQYGKTIGSTGVVSLRQNRQIAEIDSGDQSAIISAYEAGEVSDRSGNFHLVCKNEEASKQDVDMEITEESKRETSTENATEIIDEVIQISMLSDLNDKTEEDSNNIFNLNGMAGRDSDIFFTGTNSHLAPPTGISEANIEGKGCILQKGVDSESRGAENIEDDTMDADIANI